MDEKDTLDCSKVIDIIKLHKKTILIIISVCTILAVILAFVLPKQYESNVLLRAKSTNKSNNVSASAAAAAAMLGIGSLQSNTQSYMEMMKSRQILDPIIDSLDLPDKDKIDSKSFAKSNLKITNAKGTDLIEVTGIGRSPEEAQTIAGGVAASFQQYLTDANQSENSIVMQYLKGRITLAKQEMEDAEKRLEQFRQQEKVFVPDEQAKASIDKLTELDKKLAEVQVSNESNQAQLQAVDGQLEQQNAALLQYNIADNESVQKIRQEILDKEIELTNLEQKFTDKHPSVILARQQIDELTARLQEEVSNAVAGGTATMNPVQGGLLQAKVQTETSLMVGQAQKNALQAARSQGEQEISHLSAAGLTYIGLERQSKMTQEVYVTLMKNYEAVRMQETMESMDIQIVDSANLPKRPTFPNKKLFLVLGFVIGILFSMIYITYICNKQRNVTSDRV